MLAKAGRGIVLLGGGACSRTIVYLDPKEDFTMARSRRFLAAGAVGVAAVALIAASSSVTGAYFTDSKDGSINASTGVVQVNPTSSLTLNFTNLLPGEFQTNRVTYTAAGSGGEDIWLVFNDVANNVNFLSGASQPGPAPLGGFGHFALNSAAGSFSSWNLASGASQCVTDGNGHGGSDVEGTKANPVPYCPVPKAIMLSNNLKYGDTGYADITFGFTKRLTAPQGSTPGDIAPYKIVATQHGILPGDANNVAGN